MAAETSTIQSAQDQGALASFSWDNGDSGSFFGVGGGNGTEELDEVEEIVTTVKEVAGEEEDDDLEEVFKQQSPKDTKPKAPTKKEAAEKKAKQEPEERDEEDDEELEEDTEDFFEQGSKDKKDKSDKGTEKSTSKSVFADLALDLRDRGTFRFAKVEDDAEIDEDRLHDLVDQEVEGRTDETFEAFFEDLGDDGKDFLKFSRDGGNFSDFARVYGRPTLGIEEFDVNEENHRKQVITHYLMSMDDELTQQEAEEQFEVLEENGKSKKLSERYFAKIQQQDAEEKRQLLVAQQEAAQNRDKAVKAFQKTLTESINSTDEYKGFTFSTEEKKKLNNSILKPTIQVGKGKYIPAFNHKLGEILKAQSPEARQKLLLIAKLVESDFDMSDFSAKVVTKKAREVQSRLRTQQQGVRPSSSGINSNKKSLAEYID